MTVGCLRSVRDRTLGVEYELILVDNASDRPYNRMSLVDRVVRTEESLTVGGACALGERAASPGTEMLLLLNNDTQIARGDWLLRLLTAIDKRLVVGVGPKQVRPDGTIYATEVVFDEHRMPYHAHMGMPGDLCETNFEREVLALNFGCVLLRRRALQEFPFDPRYTMFGHYQDIDWCLRVRQKGWRLLYTPSAEIVHHGGATVRQHNDYCELSLKRNSEAFRERWRWADPVLFGERSL